MWEKELLEKATGNKGERTLSVKAETSQKTVCDGLIATSHITALSMFILVNTCAHYKALACWQVQLHFTDGGIEAEKG